MRKRTAHQGHIPVPVGFWRAGRRRQCPARLLFRQCLHATGCPHAVDVPLRQHGPEPRGQAAASVEVAEQRLPPAVTVAKPEQFGVQRIGDLAGPAARVERVRRPIEQRALLEDEVFPRLVVARGTRAGEREIVEVQRRTVALEIASRRRLSRERARGAGG